MSKYKNYIKREVDGFSDAIITEAMEYNRGNGTVAAYFIGTSKDTVRNVLSAAASVVLAVAVIIAFILMRQSITPPPADTTEDTGTGTGSETVAESETETETESETETDASFESSNEDYEYTVKNGEVTLNRYIGISERVTIPLEIDGYPVSHLGQFVLGEYEWGTSKTGMFAGSFAKYITVPGSVAVIDCFAFVDADEIEAVELEEGVQLIEDTAFWFCSSLRKVTIPKSVEYIGDEAFPESGALKTVYYRGTEDEWNALLSLSAPNTGLIDVTVIFEGDDEETEDTENTDEPIETDPPEPPEIKTTEDGLYEYYVNADGNVTIVKYLGDEKEVIVPETIGDVDVSVIGEGAFLGCDMEIVHMPMLGTIEKSAFEGCVSLESVYISGIAYINERAFYGCEKLTTAELGYFLGCRFIGDYAFYGCDLRAISFPLTVYDIGAYAFAENNNLEKIEFPTSLATSDGYDSMTLGKYAFSGTAVSSVTVYRYVTSIPEGAFANNRNLKTLYIRDGVESIGRYAFGNCPSLTEMLMAKSVSEIEKTAFDGCLSLSHVTYVGKETEWGALSESVDLGDAKVDCIGDTGVMIRQAEGIETVDLAEVLKKHGLGGYVYEPIREHKYLHTDEILTDVDGGYFFSMAGTGVMEYTMVKLYPDTWNAEKLWLPSAEDADVYFEDLRRKKCGLETSEYSIYLGGPAGDDNTYDSPEDVYILYKDSGEIFKIYDLYTPDEADAYRDETGTPLPEIPVSVDEAAVWNGRLLIGQVCAGNSAMGVILFDLETKKTEYFHYYEFCGLTGDTLHLESFIEGAAQMGPPEELSFEPIDISPYLDAYKGLSVNFLDWRVSSAYYNDIGAFNSDGTLFAYVEGSRDGALGYNVLTVVDIESGETEEYMILEYCTWDYGTGIDNICFTEEGDIFARGINGLVYIVRR